MHMPHMSRVHTEVHAYANAIKLLTFHIYRQKDRKYMFYRVQKLTIRASILLMGAYK